MSQVYTTKQGDVIDNLCKSIYGDEFLLVSVLEANPHLCEYPAVLPLGIDIFFPDFPEPSNKIELVRLWS